LIIFFVLLLSVLCLWALLSELKLMMIMIKILSIDNSPAFISSNFVVGLILFVSLS